MGYSDVIGQPWQERRSVYFPALQLMETCPLTESRQPQPSNSFLPYSWSKPHGQDSAAGKMLNGWPLWTVQGIWQEMCKEGWNMGSVQGQKWQVAFIGHSFELWFNPLDDGWHCLINSDLQPWWLGIKHCLPNTGKEQSERDCGSVELDVNLERSRERTAPVTTAQMFPVSQFSLLLHCTANNKLRPNMFCAPLKK